MECPQCKTSFKKKHTCKAGTCADCKKEMKNLDLHQCTVRKILEYDVELALGQLKTYGPRCDGCLTHHFINKNTHSFKKFRKLDLCCDCYRIPEIKAEIDALYTRLRARDLHLGNTACCLCTVQLMDRDGTTLRLFERDHIDVFSKTASVFELVSSGAPWDVIVEEYNKCRTLCIRCHSAVTLAERSVGILRLKSLDVTDHVKSMARQKVDELACKLLM
jgi:hypothetical protein